MIKNLIIISLVVLLVTQTDMTLNDFLDIVDNSLDKIQQLVYNVKSEVN